MPDIKPDAIKAQRKGKFILRSRGEERRGDQWASRQVLTEAQKGRIIPSERATPAKAKKPNSLLHSATRMSPNRVGVGMQEEP